jgi:hypothetical protein
MHLKTVFAVATAGALAVSLAGCGAPASEPIGGDVIAPVTMSVNELQGESVDLVVGQVLNISTDSLAVDSYTGEVSDPDVVEFTEGRIDDSAEFNPGVTALAEGRSEVTMTNDQGGIQPLTFTVVVSAAQ